MNLIGTFSQINRVQNRVLVLLPFKSLLVFPKLMAPPFVFLRLKNPIILIYYIWNRNTSCNYLVPSTINSYLGYCNSIFASILDPVVSISTQQPEIPLPVNFTYHFPAHSPPKYFHYTWNKKQFYDLLLQNMAHEYSISYSTSPPLIHIFPDTMIFLLVHEHPKTIPYYGICYSFCLK